MRFNYPGYLEPNELGGYSVWFPDLPECHTDGDDLDDAVNMAAEALELVLESYIENGRELPEPTLDAPVPEGARGLLVSVDVDSENRLVTAYDAAKMPGVSDARVR
ncbi:type II toxin-antitoxin system HicB family antitoxin [Olsenella uli]|uniref:type II toxin-antitoxin system HicB family antitoxin n=1 Tax=Olsenella uli TaxID=133926 RepID=UPI0019593B8E|nr:type II toxin-antitoxin system HicB family antitoxin [Olsenella uli]MBM6676137.1 type II toxin-antitoxin system HicB family antitoxin [Olsenella uli]